MLRKVVERENGDSTRTKKDAKIASDSNRQKIYLAAKDCLNLLTRVRMENHGYTRLKMTVCGP